MDLGKTKNSPCLVEQSACAQGSHFERQQTTFSPVSGVRMKKQAAAVSLRSIPTRAFYHLLRQGNAHRMLSASHARTGLYSSNAKEICHCLVIEQCQREIGNCTDNLWMCALPQNLNDCLEFLLYRKHVTIQACQKMQVNTKERVPFAWLVWYEKENLNKIDSNFYS